MTTKDKLVDLLERAGWTAAQAAVSLLAVEVSGMPTWWALPLATGLSAAKTWLMNRGKGQVGA
jgi:hypothetical protein